MIAWLTRYLARRRIARRDKRRGYTDADVDRVYNKMHGCTRLPGAWICVTEAEMKAWRDAVAPTPDTRRPAAVVYHFPQKKEHTQ